MSESLRDQLLKSGLAKKLKVEAPAPAKPHGKGQGKPYAGKPPHAQAAKTHPGKPHPSNPHPGKPHQAKGSSSSEPNLAHAYALRAKQEKDERDSAQREAERIAREKRERKQKLQNLLDAKALNAADADTPRHFPHGNKIRRVYCTAAQLAELNRGDLAVVQLAGRYLLVTRDVALQARAIDEQALVLLCDPNAPPEDDVPADLVW